MAPKSIRQWKHKIKPVNQQKHRINHCLIKTGRTSTTNIFFNVQKVWCHLPIFLFSIYFHSLNRASSSKKKKKLFIYFSLWKFAKSTCGFYDFLTFSSDIFFFFHRKILIFCHVSKLLFRATKQKFIFNKEI